jgi:hypothetical protein
MAKQRKPIPKSQREISEGLQTPSYVQAGNPNGANQYSVILIKSSWYTI